MPASRTAPAVTKVESEDPIRCNFHLPSCILHYDVHQAAPLDVITSYLIFRLSQPSLALQFLCAVGFCLGAAIFLRGLRLRRTRIQVPASRDSISWETNRHPFPQRTDKVAAAPPQEITRLSLDPAPMKSAEMSQQQKIAAALARAGMSRSTAWSEGSTGVAVETDEPDPFEPTAVPIQELHAAQLMPATESTRTSHLLILCGLAVALVSCYLLVTFH
jgi:hypothetical protein